LEAKAPQLELCLAEYSATEFAHDSAGKHFNLISVTAKGFHNTTGYIEFFTRLPSIDPASPPQLILWHIKPTGFVGQVVTPFSVSIDFQDERSHKQVLVLDHQGEHKIDVHIVKSHV
jgi:hypothetical protein